MDPRSRKIRRQLICERSGQCRWSGLKAAVLTTTIACGGCTGATVSQNIAGPTVEKCQPTVAGLPETMGAAGGEIAARVMTTADCTWSITTTAAWLRVEPPSGQGEASLVVHVSANQVSSGRSGEIDVNGVRVQVTQAAAPPPPPPPPDPEPRPAPAPPAPAPAPAPPSPTPPPTPTPTPTPPQPPPPTPVDFKGKVEGLSGTCPVLSFTVGGRRVETDAQTRFSGGKCGDLRNGREVEIDGERRANGTVYALRVDLKK